MEKNLTYCFDLDGTLCSIVVSPEGKKEYPKAQPYRERIAKVNKLYDAGHTIKIETARGAQSGLDWKEFTRQQLSKWGLKYHVLRVGVKMHATWYIDDKGLSDKQFFND